MARTSKLPVWLAIVVIDGVPEVTEQEMARMAEIVPGSIAHTTQRGVGRVDMQWRFEHPARDAAQVMTHVSRIWRDAVSQVASAVDVRCTSFRVTQMSDPRPGPKKRRHPYGRRHSKEGAR